MVPVNCKRRIKIKSKSQNYIKCKQIKPNDMISNEAELYLGTQNETAINQIQRIEFKISLQSRHRVSIKW